MKYNKDNIVEKLKVFKSRLWLTRNKNIIDLAVHEILRLQDEIESVWQMIDEINASDINNFRSSIETGIASKILETSRKKRGNKNGSN